MEKQLSLSENSVIQYIYIELNELIVYTIKKSIEDYTLKDFWIRFLSNYEQDKKSGMLKKLCELEEGIRMAEETILRVTEEERRMARELSREKYQMLLEAERGDARREGIAEGRAEGFADGEYKTKLDMARLMKNMNYSLDDICKITGLAPQEIK